VTEFTKIPPTALGHVVADVMPMLEDAAKDSYYPVEHFVRRLYDGTLQLWAAIDGKNYIAICLTEVLSYPGRRSVNICGLSGQDHTRWIDFIHEIEDAARAVGCQQVEITGRLAWRRLLPDYKQTAIVLVKELDGQATG